MTPDDKEAFDARMRGRGQSEDDRQRRWGTPAQCRSDDIAREAERLMAAASALLMQAEACGFRLTITRVPVAPLSMGSATGLVEIWRHNNDGMQAIGFAPGLEG